MKLLYRTTIKYMLRAAVIPFVAKRALPVIAATVLVLLAPCPERHDSLGGRES